MSGKLLSYDYEVFGVVQGVFFRKYTQTEAKKLKLVGWVQNTRNDTVIGQVQGKQQDAVLMKNWLSKVGSPSSTIDKCDIKNEKEISQLEFNRFDIR
jgi:acylphosphatase